MRYDEQKLHDAMLRVAGIGLPSREQLVLVEALKRDPVFVKSMARFGQLIGVNDWASIAPIFVFGFYTAVEMRRADQPERSIERSQPAITPEDIDITLAELGTFAGLSGRVGQILELKRLLKASDIFGSFVDAASNVDRRVLVEGGVFMGIAIERARATRVAREALAKAA